MWKLFQIKDEDIGAMSSVFIVNCEHISNFILIVEFEHTNVCWLHIEKINTLEDKIGYIMGYVVVF